MNKTPALILGCAALLVVSGCGRVFKTTCVKPGDYAGAVNMPPLKVPAGRDAPDTRRAMPIPALETPEKPPGGPDECLDAPPRYAIPKQTPPAA